MFYFAHSAIIGLYAMLYIIQLIVLFMHLFITLLILRRTWRQTCSQTLMLRDHVFYFPNGFSMSHDELNDIINYINFA